MQDLAALVGECIRVYSNAAKFDVAGKQAHFRKHGGCGKMFKQARCRRAWDSVPIADDAAGAVLHMLSECTAVYCPLMRNKSQVCAMPPILSQSQFNHFVDDMLRVDWHGVDALAKTTGAATGESHVFPAPFVIVAGLAQGFPTRSNQMTTNPKYGRGQSKRWCPTSTFGIGPNKQTADHCYVSAAECARGGKQGCQAVTKTHCFDKFCFIDVKACLAARKKRIEAPPLFGGGPSRNPPAPGPCEQRWPDA